MPVRLGLWPSVLRPVLRPKRNVGFRMAKPKPNKPYADYPLYAHAGGVWAKKIRGKVHYFGPWSDPGAALGSYLAQRDHLLAGRVPPPEKPTVGLLLDDFLREKRAHLATGDITESTFAEYEVIAGIIRTSLGRHPVDNLEKQDFERLRKELAKGTRKASLSPATLKRRLTVARMVFCDLPRGLLKPLKAPPLRSLRAVRREKGELLYSATDIRAIVGVAEPELKAMVLLGINCAFGPKDAFSLPATAIVRGWHNFARPKTGVERRAPLWPETLSALQGVTLPMAGWDRFRVDREFKKACKQADVECRGFYTLRRTFETVATTADVPQAIIDSIMGHARNDMASVYRQKVYDQQLAKCAEHVRQWYLGKVIL